MAATLSSTLVIPTHATTSTFSTDGTYLAVGSDDGSVRLYRPPEVKVQKAIRGLGASVSSVLFHASGVEDVWIAVGKSILRFDISSPKMILSLSDAKLTKDIGQDDEDVVNQLALSANDAYLACTTDNGGVYVLDINSGEVSKMKTSHDSIAWTACFIPDRPSELLTGGYDCTLLLHDFKLRTLLARFSLPPEPALAPGLTPLPPFITSLALSPQGIVAAGTADGRIWIGLGGSKSRHTAKKGKRSKKWGGLSAEEGFFTKVGEGMVVGLAFVEVNAILSCTVHGKLALHRLTSSSSSAPNSRQGTSANPSPPPAGLQTLWTAQSACAKVDTLSISLPTRTPGPEGGAKNDEEKVATVVVTGLHADKDRGAVELWTLPTSGEGGLIQDGIADEADMAVGAKKSVDESRE